MRRTAKLALYRAARAAGLFRRARRATRDGVRILAYHAFSDGEVVHFRSKLFIRLETFRRRLEWIRREGYRVLSLGAAVDQLQAGAVGPDSVVITIDDGFASTLEAARILRDFGFPATLYATTYYMSRQSPVFDLAAAFLLWKAGRPAADLVWPERGLTRRLDLGSVPSREAETRWIVDYGHTLDGEAARVELCRRIGQAVGVDYDEVAGRGWFRLLSFAEARQLAALGIDIDLHTHRHRFPADDPAICRAELAENRRALAEEVGRDARHFCYPSGLHAAAHERLLRESGIVSATTCEAGLARPRDSLLRLPRVLDGEMVHPLEFEAELSGFADILRRRLRRAPSTAGRD